MGSASSNPIALMPIGFGSGTEFNNARRMDFKPGALSESSYVAPHRISIADVILRAPKGWSLHSRNDYT
jgi:hypothetical protein